MRHILTLAQQNNDIPNLQGGDSTNKSDLGRATISLLKCEFLHLSTKMWQAWIGLDHNISNISPSCVSRFIALYTSHNIQMYCNTVLYLHLQMLTKYLLFIVRKSDMWVES